MLPIRLAIALIFLGGLVLFTVQNLSPALSLVILGSSTLPLPLAIWIGGAIAAGAVTTVVLSALADLSRPARPSAPKRPRPAANRVDGFQTPWTPQPQTSPQAGATRLQDDWETRSTKDEWDDWEEPAPRSTNRPPVGYRSSQPDIRDRRDDDWADWGDYAETRRQDRSADRLDMPDSYTPRRTEFETKQEPVTRTQSGSVYSYSYNRPEEPADRADVPPRTSNEVYDADYRVLTPPYRPEPQPPVEDDWGFEEDELDRMEPDEPTERHDRRPGL
ncbi:hypothetical protein IFO70_19260 [Phormidium tenue FACHB-886]|nr:hypothetical protein [Phormidium tenue FACHB-886]